MQHECGPSTFNQPSDLQNPLSFPALAPPAADPPDARRLPGYRWHLCRVTALVFVALGGIADAQPAAFEPSGAISESVPFAQFVAEAALRFGIPDVWIAAVMRAESAGEVHAVSPKGAMGLMQIMPVTWSELRSRIGLGADPFDPHDNILAGAAYLRDLHDRYGSAGFLAAYNAGPARYDAHLAMGEPLPPETQAYVEAVAHLLRDNGSRIGSSGAIAVQPWTQSPLFPARLDGAPTKETSHIDEAAVRTGTVPSASNWVGLKPPSTGLFANTQARESGS